MCNNCRLPRPYREGVDGDTGGGGAIDGPGRGSTDCWGPSIGSAGVGQSSTKTAGKGRTRCIKQRHIKQYIKKRHIFMSKSCISYSCSAIPSWYMLPCSGLLGHFATAQLTNCCQLWWNFKVGAFRKLIVNYHNVLKRLIGHSKYESTSMTCTSYRDQSCEALIRNVIYNFFAEG